MPADCKIIRVVGGVSPPRKVLPAAGVVSPGNVNVVDLGHGDLSGAGSGEFALIIVAGAAGVVALVLRVSGRCFLR